MILCDKGFDTTLWVRDAAKADTLMKERVNEQYLPNVTIPKELHVTSDVDTAGTEQDLFLIVVPTHAFRDTLKLFSSYIEPTDIVVSASKGMEQGTNFFMTDIIGEMTGAGRAVLSGPNHAEEVAKKIPSATVISSEDQYIMDLLLKVFATGYFRTYGNSDMRGIQLCAAVKNVIAIGAGAADGLGLGDNAKAGIITRGVSELTNFGIHQGDMKKETFFGLAGIGDLIATCVSKHSRNRRFGEFMGKGYSFDDATKAMGGMVVEGVNTSKVIESISKKSGHCYTIPHEVYHMIFEGKDPAVIVEDIMTREPKPEM